MPNGIVRVELLQIARRGEKALSGFILTAERMLTKTLRQLERDGLVTRHVHPVVPPRVDYRLTPLGMSLAQALCGIWMWAGEHFDHVDRARREFDSRNASPLR
jgi:DNA-binding HxlR family transcriptional regulator